PELRLPRQPQARHTPTTLLSSARLSTAGRTRHIRQQSLKRSLAMPKMRWTDDGHRKTHRCRNPTSFSSHSSHRGRMKRLSTTRNLCVCQRAQSLCALPFHKPRLSVFSSLVFVRVLRFRGLSIPWCRLPCSTAQLRRTSTPHLPSIEFA